MESTGLCHLYQADCLFKTFRKAVMSCVFAWNPGFPNEISVLFGGVSMVRVIRSILTPVWFDAAMTGFFLTKIPYGLSGPDSFAQTSYPVCTVRRQLVVEHKV